MMKIAPDLCISPNKAHVQAPTFTTRPVTSHYRVIRRPPPRPDRLIPPVDVDVI